MLYLDHNAATPVRTEVLSRMAEVVRQPGNPQSPHLAGQNARRRLEWASAALRRLVGAPETYRVVHTGGGAEANRLAVIGLMRRQLLRGRPRLLISAVEHPSVVAAAREVLGAVVEVLPVTGDGAIDVDRVRLGPDVGLVAVTLASHETGVIQPVRRLAQLAADAGALVHTDAALGAGKLSMDVVELGAASLALQAGTLGGPSGAGALILRQDAEPAPLFGGGGQEGGFRSGTQAVALAVGFGVAAELAKEELESGMARMAACRDELERALLSEAQGFVVGAGAARLPNTTALGFSGVPATVLRDRADALGICIHAVSPEPLVAMGLPLARASEVVRLSLGHDTTADEVRQAAALLGDAVRKRAA